MPVIPGREQTFDAVAALYEKARPGYPAALFADIFRYCPLGPHSRVLEIGIGAGEATEPFLRLGCKVEAVECGANFAALCREKFRAWPRFSVRAGKFEQAELPAQSYDLIFAATAFHWVPEETGYPKVLRLLKPGGAFARFANNPYVEKERPAFAQAIQQVYRRYRGEQDPPPAYTAARAQATAAIAARYGFVDIGCRLYHRTRTLSAAQYLDLLGTYSDYLAMPAAVRQAFAADLSAVIAAHGGEVRLYDTLDLELARRRSC